MTLRSCRRLLRAGLPPATLLAAALVTLFATAARADLEGQLAERLQHALGSGGMGQALAYVIAFGAGLATSLTPCVYPLIPITVSLFGARDDEVSRARALFLAACYVGGIAFMYSGLGVFFALTGKAFGTFMASRYVIIPIAVFFLAMAASMFGAFELSLPVELQGRLTHVGGKGPRGAFLMGLVAGIVAAPCTGPPLAVLLAFVSTQRSVVLGGSLLFVYALGMGMLFFAIAGFALKLPRSGPWMDGVKSFFGILMITAALFFLRNVAPPLRDYGKDTTTFLGVQLGLIIVGVALGAIHLTFHEGALRSLRKGLGVIATCAGLFGVIAWLLATPPIEWLKDEAQGVALAQREHRPILIDFAADWCLPCKELERKTFADPRVSQELSRFVLVRVDCTDPDDKIEAVKARYGAETLPTVVIKDGAGNVALKLNEFTPPERLLPVLQKLR